MKYPPGVPRGNAATTPKQITIQGPRYDALYVDSIYCDLAVDFEYDGRGVGKVAMRAGARSDAVGKGLNIQAHIVDDARTFTGGSGGPSQTFAGIRITLEYSFTQTIADDIVVHAQAMLYGNGDYDIEYHLIQGSVDTMPPAVTSGVHATASPSVPQQAQSLGGDTDVLRSIGGFIVDHFNPTEDGITADLEQWPKRSDRQIGGAKKFPFDDQSQVGDGATQHQQITVTCPHSTSGNFCDLVVSWDYNGRWLTNVDIAKGHAHGVPVLERLDYKYSVTAQIEDIPNAAYTPRDAPQTPACAALRVNIEWYETRPVVENTLCRCVLTIFANGAWQADYSLLSGEVEDPGVAINFIGARPPMRSVGTGQAQSLADTAPSPVTHSSETRGAVRFELDQYTGMKQPANVAPSGTPAQTATVRIGGPRATAATGGEESYGDCEIAYDYDGRGVGNVHVRPTTTGGTAALVVAETIDEDSQLYALPGSTDPLAALKLHFEYRFDSTRPLKTDVTLYGNGRQDIHYDWSQV
jgi:hypothetical protein